MYWLRDRQPIKPYFSNIHRSSYRAQFYGQGFALIVSTQSSDKELKLKIITVKIMAFALLSLTVSTTVANAAGETARPPYGRTTLTPKAIPDTTDTAPIVPKGTRPFGSEKAMPSPKQSRLGAEQGVTSFDVTTCNNEASKSAAFGKVCELMRKPLKKLTDQGYTNPEKELNRIAQSADQLAAQDQLQKLFPEMSAQELKDFSLAIFDLQKELSKRSVTAEIVTTNKQPTSL